MLEKTEGAIKNGQYRDKCSIGQKKRKILTVILIF